MAAKSQATAPAAPNRSGHAVIGELRMYYEVHGGDRPGPPVLLLHGGITTIETSFQQMLPELAKRRRVIAVEQQAHGRTADIDRPLTFEQEADDTADLLRQLKVTQADVFGYSDGGNVAFGLAIRHPDLVRSLVTAGVNTDNDGLQPEILAFIKTAAAQAPAAAAEQMPAEFRDAYKRVAPRPQDWPVLVSKVMRQGAALKGWTAAQLKAIRAPVLIVVGDRDIIRPEHALEMHRLIPDSQLAMLPGADHMLTDDPLIVPMTLRFLDSLRPPPRP